MAGSTKTKDEKIKGSRNKMKLGEICGQYVAKRALEVCKVGNLSILLVGPLGSSKTTLRDVFSDVKSDERETCPCGHFLGVRTICVCSPRTIIRWYRRLERLSRDFDVVLECHPVTNKEIMGHKIDTQEDYLSEQRIADARKFAEKNNTTIELSDDSARAIMEMATRRLALSPGQYTRIMMVARAIANLDHSINLRGKHVAEAVQYRADRTVYSLDRIVEKLGVK